MANDRRSASDVLKQLENNVLPYIGELQAAEVEPFHVSEILFEIINRGAPVVSNRVRSHLHAAFTYGTGFAKFVLRDLRRTVKTRNGRETSGCGAMV